MVAAQTTVEPTVELETVTACDLCGGGVFDTVRVWRDPILEGPEQWHLVRCRGCKLHFINPRPSRASIGRFYPSTYAAHTKEPSKPKPWHERVAAKDAAPLRPWERPWFHIRQNVSWYRFPSWRNAGDVVDIGSGNGSSYLDVLKGLGWNTHAVDASPEAVAALTSKGHVARRGVAEESHFADESMDVVTMWHCLEHTHSPRTALANARRLLRPDGLLSLGVPNWNSVHARLFRFAWQSAEPPRHLYQFTKATLGRYFEEVGLEIVSMSTRTGATAWPRAIRLVANSLFGTRWQKEPGWSLALFDPAVALMSLVGYFGVGAELRVLAKRI